MHPSVPATVRFVFIAAISLCASCAKSSIGVEPCVDDSAKCGTLPLDRGAAGQTAAPTKPEGDVQAIEMTPLTELTPVSMSTLPAPGGAHPDYGMDDPILDRDVDGHLIYFYLQSSNRSAHVIAIDDEGKPLEDVMIAEPTDFYPYPSPTWGPKCDSALCVNEPGPVLKLAWNAHCDSGSDGSCVMGEKLYFGSDLHAPTRIVRGTGSLVVNDVVRDAPGNVFAVDVAAHSVTKLEAGSGRASWKRDDFIANVPSDLIAAAPLGDGRLLVALDASGVASPGGTGVMFLIFLDSDGNAMPVPWNLATSVATLLPGKDRVSVVVSLEGDLEVVRLTDANHQQGVRFQRDDYTLLYREATAIDDDGNVYIGTRSGARDNPKPTLCKANVDGGGSCYTLPSATKIDQIVARNGGDVFIRSGRQLQRLAYPQ